jgi:hypothetical protein
MGTASSATHSALSPTFFSLRRSGEISGPYPTEIPSLSTHAANFAPNRRIREALSLRAISRFTLSAPRGRQRPVRKWQGPSSK